MKKYIFLLFFLFSSSASAGGALIIDAFSHTGKAFRWPQNKITWYTDAGNLSSVVDHAVAVTWVQAALEDWASAEATNAHGKNVPLVNLQIEYGGDVGEDITIENAQKYLKAEPGKTVVIFDEDGSILTDLGHNTSEIIAVTVHSLVNLGEKSISRGVIIFNGLILEGDLLGATIAEKAESYRGNIQHETGHLLNLEHSQTNLDVALNCTKGGECPEAQYIPTMYPALKTTLQRYPTRDDKFTLGWLYPSTQFSTEFCSLRGELQDRNENPLRGVNIIARRVDKSVQTRRQDTHSSITGALYSGCANKSNYALFGLLPGKTYEIYYEPLTDEFNGKESDESDEPPVSGFGFSVRELDFAFEPQFIPTASGSTTVVCQNAGDVIELPTAKVDVDTPCASYFSAGNSPEYPYQAKAVSAVSTLPEEGAANASKGCSLLPLSSSEKNHFHFLFLVFPIVLLLGFARFSPLCAKEQAGEIL
ncbi:MAG: hypothetical protein COX62_07550 [Deltaproteobacteria bacterium CG_4_10_14_0_2_um_filter_43_8]|nr:MAG: hypothetical protein COV43_02970 [Deltaproteobacteria bacterium CG11_big_fil_rev_8_21_14_0_20_42_23]PJA18972.1 MAG: hypothetical protein COX62_07550 [Deltaproteobacteria bacterium CG_4_10_14_0_2_um_filter_43_8]PJC63740.1 MAG: hypothetical protein CO021_07585 [Deltaproteobacteria bacterium CG_4_9_14_0_2_um_filter_42_21]